jgi:hypothetical protein
MADLQLRRGEVASAEPLLVQAEALAHTLGSTYQLPEIYRGWALCWLARDAEQAQAYAQQALTIAREIEEPIAEGVSLRVLGLTQAALGELQHAQVNLAASCKVLAAHDPYETARSQQAMSVVSRALGDTASERALRAAARTTFVALGATFDLSQTER